MKKIKQETIMTKVLDLVKDEYKEQVKTELETATKEFESLTDDERDNIYGGDGTIGFLFDEERISLDLDDIVIDSDDDEIVDKVFDLMLDYLDYNFAN